LILLAASPGTITGVITISIAHSRDALPVTALVAVAVVTVVTWLVLIALPAGTNNGGGGGRAPELDCPGLHGLIVMAMGIQFGLDGLSWFFHGAG